MFSILLKGSNFPLSESDCFNTFMFAGGTVHVCSDQSHSQTKGRLVEHGWGTRLNHESALVNT